MVKELARRLETHGHQRDVELPRCRGAFTGCALKSRHPQRLRDQDFLQISVKGLRKDSPLGQFMRRRGRRTLVDRSYTGNSGTPEVERAPKLMDEPWTIQGGTTLPRRTNALRDVVLCGRPLPAPHATEGLEPTACAQRAGHVPVPGPPTTRRRHDRPSTSSASTARSNGATSRDAIGNRTRTRERPATLTPNS
ncbi:hypothetical protein LRS13_04950 [Svornostia abyssi]|uniref:Uncharacterized protein n=1 Tax=Svornostia abyssi TaxID=2898438 RepID=A0ABY5PJP7_9ACTN|nr:hypothetical protein LRS13_04950 [Parviterribacteraceae bacterium J379]